MTSPCQGGAGLSLDPRGPEESDVFGYFDGLLVQVVVTSPCEATLVYHRRKVVFLVICGVFDGFLV